MKLSEVQVFAGVGNRVNGQFQEIWPFLNRSS